MKYRNTYKFSFGIVVIILFNVGCGESKTNKTIDPAGKKTNLAPVEDIPEKEIPAIALKQDPMDYIPKGMVLFDKVSGDLNKDGIPDLVLMIKGTDKNKFVQDEYRGALDRNRRGILVLFKHKDGYELASKNLDCFSSENEEGGVYYAPVLSFNIVKGNLYVNYEHGRYGYWTYTFKYRNSDFELIGYDSKDSPEIPISKELSINFLAKKKKQKVVYKDDSFPQIDGPSDTEKWESIRVDKLMKLSEIKDFDELYFPEYH